MITISLSTIYCSFPSAVTSALKYRWKQFDLVICALGKPHILFRYDKVGDYIVLCALLEKHNSLFRRDWHAKYLCHLSWTFYAINDRTMYICPIWLWLVYNIYSSLSGLWFDALLYRFKIDSIRTQSYDIDDICSIFFAEYMHCRLTCLPFTLYTKLYVHQL